MQDIFGTVRRSLVFRSSPDNEEQQSPPIGSGTLVDRINSCIRKSKVFSRPSSPSIHPVPKEKENVPAIRWRKGELIGCGAFGRVYMGMNLDSGELLAVKQVLIASNCSSKEKAQAHIKDLEEEVKLLKDLSHPNIVRYLGTIREEHSLNILLEFVPGGSISSLLGKFGAFPEAVIQAYTRQLLLGLEYLHKNVIIHRDIKGANILVDNKGCIKLADFGASKQVVELATISGAKSMKGTPYWMAPEVIIQTGHSFSADIWSVGCTVIEMATGKPPWSQQYQEVAALFHVGTTKSHPPIPEHLSAEAKDFLLKCLQEEPNLRPTASELLKHPFVTGENMEPQPVYCPPVVGCPEVHLPSFGRAGENLGTNINTESTCQIDVKFDSMSDEARLGMDFPESLKSFNPMCEPIDDGWGCEFVETSIVEQNKIQLGANQQVHVSAARTETLGEDKHFSFACGPSLFEDDDELTESKITAFLDEKALELKKLQTPLYEEFYNSLNDPCPSGLVENMHDENPSKYLKLPPKSRSPNQGSSGTPSTASDPLTTGIPIRNSTCTSNVCNANDQSSHEISSPPVNDWKELLVDDQLKQSGPSAHFSNIQRKWKEELDQELERKREMMRQAAVGGKTSSSKDRAVGRQRDRTRFASPGK